MIWIIGNAGMLGTELTETLTAQFGEVVGTDRDVSILEPVSLQAFAQGKQIDWIINCSAYTAVDKAEDDVELCYALNETGAKNIAEIATAIGAKMVHISTDYVFDGTSSTPLTEDASTAPIGVYGASKLAGENRIREIAPNHFIVRTAWLYGKHGNNFVETMIRLMTEKEQIGVIADQIGSPTAVTDLVSVIAEIIKQNSTAFGTYHYSDEGEISWHGFAVEIQKQSFKMGILSKMIPVNALTSEQYPTRAKRPAYSLLNKTKIKSTFGVIVPAWQESLAHYLLQKGDK